MRTPCLGVALAALAAPLSAQTTGRSMQVLAPTVLGQTASFGMTYPASAVGNVYTWLWCMPQFAGTQPLSVPGFAVQGSLRVSGASSLSSYAGVLGNSGSVSHSLAIPAHPTFLGMAWDLQSIDLSAGSSTLSLSDNDLSLVVVDPPMTNMVAIQPGTFLMGSPVTPLGVGPYWNNAQSQPVHQVTISQWFWIGRYEVTRAEFQAVMGYNPNMHPSQPNAPQLPVEFVNWDEAVAYCAALTASEQAAGRLLPGYEYRLPTEAEWEYCCRAGTTTEYSFGASLTCANANVSLCGSRVATTPVGSYPPNAWGLYDMHGNVWEWCLDAWDHTANYPAGPVIDPYVQSGASRILRGGGWDNSESRSRSAFRYGDLPTWRWYDRGFRVVLAPILP